MTTYMIIWRLNHSVILELRSATSLNTCLDNSAQSRNRILQAMDEIGEIARPYGNLKGCLRNCLVRRVEARESKAQGDGSDGEARKQRWAQHRDHYLGTRTYLAVLR